MKPIREATDEELTRQTLQGDHSAFEELVGRYQARVYGLARRLTGHSADAEEVLQETFLNVYRKLGGFRGDAKFSTWLFRVATNTARMQGRSRARRRSESLEEYMPRFDAEGRHAYDVDHARAARADELIDRKRLAKAAGAALERLPEPYRAPFVLRDLEELSTSDVADVLRVTPAVVRQRVHRARLMLRGYLSHLVGVEP